MMNRRRRGSCALVTVLLLASVTLTACRDGIAPYGVVTVLGSLTGTEEQNFRAVLDRFEERTGIRAEYEGTRAVTQVLRSSVQQGEPPDIAIVPSPQDLVEYVENGELRPLDGVLADEPYSDQWRRLQRIGQDRAFAVALKVELKSLVWYSGEHYTAPEPRTWAELVAISEEIADKGQSPWCVGMESAPTSGWPGTDWIEDILLHQAGPTYYRAWAAGEVPWTFRGVRAAWQEWGEIVGRERMLHGGAEAALLTNFGDAGIPLAIGEPGCVLEHQASSMMGFYLDHLTDHQPPGLSASQQGSGGLLPVRYFPFPPFNGTGDPATSPVLVSADLAGMFNDTPQAREFMEYLATTEAQRTMPEVTRGRTFSANTEVYPGATWSDPKLEGLGSGIARQLTDGTRTLCFDGSDLMPSAMRNAFYHAVLRYIAEPAALDELLAQLEDIRRGLRGVEIAPREVWFPADYPRGADGGDGEVWFPATYPCAEQ